jgi:hypothetical protein
MPPFHSILSPPHIRAWQCSCWRVVRGNMGRGHRPENWATGGGLNGGWRNWADEDGDEIKGSTSVSRRLPASSLGGGSTSWWSPEVGEAALPWPCYKGSTTWRLETGEAHGGGCRGKLIEEVGEDRDGLTIWRGTRRRRQRAHIKYVHPHPHAVGSLCVTEPSQKWGVRLPGSRSGDSRRSENTTNTHTKHSKP